MHSIFDSIRRALALVCAVVIAGALAACGGSGDEVLVREAATTLMETFKGAESGSIDDLVDDGTAEMLESYGLDKTEFFSHIFKNIDYEITGVTVDGDKAEVAMTVSNVSLEAALNSAAEKFNEFAATQEALELFSADGEQSLFTKLFEFFYEVIDSGELSPVTTETVLHCTKVDGVWDAPLEENADFMSALYGGSQLENLV